MILGISIYRILMEFYIFCFAGWIYESAFVSIRDKKLVNRGFLVGPILPLYGFGAVSVYILLRPFSDIPTLLYCMGMLVATTLEYITSWLMELLFHTKWWDYSKEPYNFKGRVALIPSMFWGILSLLMFDVLQPAADKIINWIPRKNGQIVLSAVILITLCDLIYTNIATINFRKQLENLYYIKNEIEEIFSNLRLEYDESKEKFLKKHPFTGNKRIIDAFPTMKFLPKNHSAVSVKELLESIKSKTEPIKEYIKMKQNKED